MKSEPARASPGLAQQGVDDALHLGAFVRGGALQLIGDRPQGILGQRIAHDEVCGLAPIGGGSGLQQRLAVGAGAGFDLGQLGSGDFETLGRLLLGEAAMLAPLPEKMAVLMAAAMLYGWHPAIVCAASTDGLFLPAHIVLDIRVDHIHPIGMTLDEWASRDKSRTDKWIGAQVGLTRSTITHIRNRTRRTSLAKALALSRLTGGVVTVDDFLIAPSVLPAPALAGAEEEEPQRGGDDGGRPQGKRQRAPVAGEGGDQVRHG